MQAITTKILPSTNHRSTRVKAMAKAGSIVVSTDQYENTNKAHQAAAKALCVKMNWQGYLVQGIDHKEDNVFTFLPHIASVPRWEEIIKVGNPVERFREEATAIIGNRQTGNAEQWTPTEFVEYLQSTLIPDLRESGRDCTADDFATAICLIEQLQAERAEAIER